MFVRLTELVARGINRYNHQQTAHRIFSEQGFHLLSKQDYYLPIPQEEDLGDAFWEKRSEMVGVDLNEGCALGLLNDVFPAYVGEFRETFPLHQSGDSTAFYLINGSFMAIDAQVYYSFIRHFRPKRIVEIGSGRSTQVAAAACLRNAKELGEAPHLTAIEPFPAPLLEAGLPGLSELIVDKVQNVDLNLFTSLEAGDILFIDSTHALREGGDVQMEYCEILPRLADGVIVHIHDISLPKAYPRTYFENSHHYWNEQYLLQAFLAFNSRFEVIWPGNYMMLKHPERVCEVFPEYHTMRETFPQSEPSSFWMRVRS
ncbi:MAG TPA: class I SAM-dependent methyltransferase [Pyrinomonadaceae bacterium]|jgi:hypothetical protein